MPFDRYTLDPDGGFTFADSASGQTMRAAGQEAARRAAELDYQQTQAADADSLYAPTPMALPERGPDTRLAANPGAVTDLGDQAPIDAGPPLMSAAQAAAALPAAGGPAAAALAQPSPVTPVAGQPPPAPPQPPPVAAPVPPPVAAPAAPVEGAAPMPVIHRPGDPAAAVPPPAEPAYDLMPVGSTTTGGSVTSGGSTSRSLGPDPKKQAALRKAETEQGAVEKKLVELQSKVAQEQESILEKDARVADENKFRIEMVNQETDARMAKILDRRMAKIAALEATPDVDPNKMWNDMSTGRKVAAIIGVALGGFGGGQNDALGMLQTAINRDIAAQQGAIDKKKGEFTMLGQAAEDVRQLGGDRIAQSLAMRSAAADLAVVQIKRTAAKADAAVGYTPAYDAKNQPIPQTPYALKAAALIAKIKTGQAADDAALSERMRGTVTTQSQSTRSTQTTREDMAAVPRAPADADDGTQKLMFNGRAFRLGKHIESKEAEKFRDQMIVIDTLKTRITKMKELRKSLGEKAVSSAQYQLLSNQVSASGSILQKMGVLQGGEREELFGIFKNFRAGDESIAEMDQLADQVGGSILNQAFAKPIATGASGAPEPPRVLRGGASNGKGKHK